MNKELEKIIKQLEEILDIVLHNNNLAGFISEQLNPCPPKIDKAVVNSPEEMIEEVYRYKAQNEVIGEA